MWLNTPLSPVGVERIYYTISILILSCFFPNTEYNIGHFYFFFLVDSIISVCSLWYNLLSSSCDSKMDCCCLQVCRPYTGPSVHLLSYHFSAIDCLLIYIHYYQLLLSAVCYIFFILLSLSKPNWFSKQNNSLSVLGF